MHVTYFGNFRPPHSTENHVMQALEALGDEVDARQENDLEAWGPVPDSDLVLWTRTWDLPDFPQRTMLDACAARGIPTVGFHLDRWWGLDRQHEITEHPFFSCSLVITADGGHDDEWKTAGVNHHWMPPAVSEFECRPGLADFDAYGNDVTFVGSWGGYHPEWPHRAQLIAHLQEWFDEDGRLGLWPKPNQEAVRGAPLRDLYASTKVCVGDSCLVPPIHHYWSDRIPETLGRGGFLLHPHVDGLDEYYTPGEHLVCWTLGDWDELRELIEYYVSHDDERQKIADAGRDHVLAHHTYTERMRQLWRLTR